jgi:integrase/recombinase XerC
MQSIFINPHLVHDIQKWLDYLTKNLNYSDKTIAVYRHNVTTFINFMNHKHQKSLTLSDIMALKLADFRDYLDFRKNTDLIIHRSLTRNLSAIKNFYGHQERYTGLRNEDLAHLTIRYKNRLLPKPIEQNDVFSILDYLKTNSDTEHWVCLRNYALGVLLYGTGLRISEALSLTFSDTTTHNTYLKIKGKGDKIRNTPYTENIRETIMAYINACPFPLADNTHIFIGVRGGTLDARVFYKVLQQAHHYLDIPYSFSAHSFRHSCASHLLNDGANLRTIQSLMGHKRLSATENYLKIDHNHLRSVIAKAHPRQTE